MSDYRVEFSSMIGPNDTERLSYLLAVVSEEDELEVDMPGNSPEQINSIIDVLKNNEFEVVERQNGSRDKCTLYARRK